MEMSDLRSQDLQNAGPAPPAYMARSCRPGGGAYEEAEATSAKLAGAEGGLTTVRGLAHSDLFQITPHRVSVAVAVGLEHQVGDAAMVACRLGAGAPPEHFHRLRGPVAQDDAEGRSEERRVGKEWRCWWSREHSREKTADGTRTPIRHGEHEG